MSLTKTTIPTVECEVIGNIDWNCFIHDFMKEIHIIEILGRQCNPKKCCSNDFESMFSLIK